MKRGDARVPGVARLNRKHFFSAFDTLKNEACKGTVWLRGFEDRDEADEADHSLSFNLTCGVIPFLARAE